LFASSRFGTRFLNTYGAPSFNSALLLRRRDRLKSRNGRAQLSPC
jgi:hypothetical protein